MLLEDLIHLLDMQPLALWQQEIDEKGANGAASSKEEEHPAESDLFSRHVSIRISCTNSWPHQATKQCGTWSFEADWHELMCQKRALFLIALYQ